jgi:hypothetical protein
MLNPCLVLCCRVFGDVPGGRGCDTCIITRMCSAPGLRVDQSICSYCGTASGFASAAVPDRRAELRPNAAILTGQLSQHGGLGLPCVHAGLVVVAVTEHFILSQYTVVWDCHATALPQRGPTLFDSYCPGLLC